MKNKDSFYIGWQDQMDANTRKRIQFFLVLMATIILLLLAVVVWKQKPFNNHRFDYGQLTSISGTYYSKPVPMLIANKMDLPPGISNQLLLVGYGKHGAEGITQSYNAGNGIPNGSKVTLQGTLIYGSGKTLLELTDKEVSIVEVEPNVNLSNNYSVSKDTVILVGEVVDPKCYFGVMKPGEGKIHKSCAIRCISGGIPPVYKTTNIGNGDQAFYILLDDSGKKINQQILPYVGTPSTISGRLSYVNGWNIVYVYSVTNTF